MDELTRHPSDGGREQELDLPLEDSAPASAGEVGQLGEPLRGDETSGLSSSAPSESVAPDTYDVRPSERRFGENVVGDGPNFQGRPNTSLSGGSDTTSAGGGGGL